MFGRRRRRAGFERERKRAFRTSDGIRPLPRRARKNLPPDSPCNRPLPRISSLVARIASIARVTCRGRTAQRRMSISSIVPLQAQLKSLVVSARRSGIPVSKTMGKPWPKLRRRTSRRKRGHGLFRFLDKVADACAIHLAVNCIAADEIRLEVKQGRAIGLAALELRRAAHLMLAEIDEMLVVDARVFDMRDERAAPKRSPRSGPAGGQDLSKSRRCCWRSLPTRR